MQPQPSQCEHGSPVAHKEHLVRVRVRGRVRARVRARLRARLRLRVRLRVRIEQHRRVRGSGPQYGAGGADQVDLVRVRGRVRGTVRVGLRLGLEVARYTSEARVSASKVNGALSSV